MDFSLYFDVPILSVWVGIEVRMESSENRKIRVGILFGGQSAEHEVSVLSALSVINHLDQEKYECFPIGIDKRGSWHFFDPTLFLQALKKEPLSIVEKGGNYPLISNSIDKGNHSFSPCQLKQTLDLLFPILHGPYGEDGTIQGVARLANLPFVGSDILSSSVCMDKSMMKIILQQAGLPTATYMCLCRHEPINYQEILKKFTFPLFIKPANLGSSIGVNKAKNEAELARYIEVAFQFDERILIEEFISGREIECSVLGNLYPIASEPGEVIPQHEFYSYEAKYLDEQGAFFDLPAKISSSQKKEIQELAIKAFKALYCEGMARVDFFLRNDGKVFVNEINTIPGFTTISLYPKLWEISGISYSQLLGRLIDLSIERFERKKRLKIDFREERKMN